jgi:hypothetical protein
VTLADQVEAAFLEQPQADCPVTHRFGPGIYIREVLLPRGAYVVGHAHKTVHLNIMLTGRLGLIDDDGNETLLSAPQTFVAGMGRKVAYIYEDVIWQNVHATTETDVAVLEDTYLDKSAVWLDHARRASLVTENYSEDNEDFAAALADLGLDSLTVRLAAERSDDLTAFPLGEYKVMTGASRIDGTGLFATGVIAVNELIAPWRLDGQRTPAGRYANHGATPNAEAVMTETGDIYLFALRPIAGCQGGQLGEEITIDYRRLLSLTCRSN